MSIYGNAKRMDTVFMEDGAQFNREYAFSYTKKLTIDQIWSFEPLLPFVEDRHEARKLLG